MGSEPLGRDEINLVAHWCASLGLTFGPTSRLSAGRSGSLVVQLPAGESSVVLKITTRARGGSGAGLERQVLTRAADQFGQLLPKLIAAGQNRHHVAVALAWYRPVPAPDRLGHGQWSGIAAGLALLHQPPRTAVPGLARRPQASADAVRLSLRGWAGIGAGTEAQRGIDVLRTEAVRGGEALPLVLTHGDCHSENIVQDRHGGYRWIDWQAACLGDGLEDLVFLWQRAEFAGACPPRQAMLAVYARAQGLDRAVLRSACDATELRLLLHAWGPFLGYGTPRGRARLRRRLAELTGIDPDGRLA